MSKKRIVKRWVNERGNYWYYTQTKYGPFWLPPSWFDVGWPTMEGAMRQLHNSDKQHPSSVVYEE